MSKKEMISEILENRAAQQGESPAYVFLSYGEAGVAEERLTYAELDARARAIGASLQAVGAGGERVALLLPPGPDFIASFFGCLYAGAVAVPALPPRPRGADPRLQAICHDARPRVALAAADKLPALERAAAEVPELRAALRMAPATEGGADWQKPDLGPESLAFLQYTSGSTSSPKGVMVSHGNLLHNEELIRQAFEQSSDSVVLGWLPLYHDMGLIGTVLQPLYAGAVCYLMTPGAFLQRPARWLEAISRYRATTSGGPNFAYELCVRKVGEAEREGLDLSSWRVAFNGAEPVRAATLRRFAETFASSGFRAEAFRPCYGLAEATLLVSGWRSEAEPRVRALDAEALERHEAVDASDALRSRELVGCGAAMQTVLAVDPDSGEPCPPGRVGEIWVASPSVAKGYWERPEETAATFGARLADGAGPFLRTGDLGFVSEGEVFLMGRLKDLIILRGRNHYPQDLELTAERSHASLRTGGGAAFAVDLDGEERLVIVHEVDRHARAGLDAEEIAAAVRRKVAEEHEVSVAEVVLIGPETLPRTSSGKVRRRVCRELYLEEGLRVLGASRLSPAAANEDPQPESSLGSPDWLRWTFAAAARVDPSRVDPDLPLSASGLDSLAAVELKQAVEEAAGVSLPLADLLEGMTLRELEQRITTGEASVAAPLAHGTGEAAGEHPLSWNQRSLWFLHLLAPESSAYNIAGAARLESSSLETLGHAFQALMDRHPMLRVTFADTPGGPVQRVAERAEAAFEIVDATGWSDEEVRARLHAESYRPFDLTAGPLLRAVLLRRGGDVFLAFAVHHVVADFWSMSVLARELGALMAGETLLPPAALYTDFALRQERMLTSPAGERLWEHWRERLAGTPQLDLPTDRPRRPVQALRGGWRTLPPSPERAEAVQRLAAAHGSTPFVALLAAWQAVLSRWSGQEEFLTGAPMAGRSAREWADVVGYFVNLVPLRADLSGDPAAGELMARTRATVLGALDHQDLPFALLTERLQPERDPSRPPLVAAMLTYEKAPAPELAALAAFAVGMPGVRLDLGGMVLESLPLAPPAAQLDLALTAAELPSGLAVSLQWDADLFDETTASRMLGHLDRLLAGMARAEHGPIADMPILSTGERDQILRAWSGADVAPAGTGCLHERFEAQAARTPEATALIAGEDRWTYDELSRRANQLAHHLRRLGAGPEKRVGVLMRRSGELIAALLGVLKAGAAYVPLDPAYPEDWRAFVAEDAGISLLLTEGGYDVSGEPEENPEPLAGPGNLAYVIYTSGSTGRPKGVALEHRGAVERMLWARAAFPSEALSGVLAATSVCFDLSVFEIFAPLSWGGTVILADNALALPSLPARDEVRLVNTVPSAMAELAAGELPPALRVVNLAGEALPPQLVERVYRHPQVEQVWNLYGPTEDTTYSTGTRVERGATRVRIGRPLPGTRAYVLDRRLQPAPAGVPGELFLAGAGGARGYHGRPDLTAERFIPDPFAALPGSRLYRTSDLARWLPSGELEHLGRLDHQVKVRGFRIELGEIETALLAHPQVEQAVVVAREVFGSKSLVAYVVPEAAGLREYLRRLLPEHMVPSFFVALPALPLTPNGKVDRKVLPAPVIPSQPAQGPLNGLEDTVAAIWCEVLDVPRVGPEDNFFDLGGHSLLLPRVQALLRERLGREVSLVELLTHSTVRALARYLDPGLAAAEPAPVAKVRRTGSSAIAIVGLAGRFPGAPDVESLWANLCAGVSSIARFSDEELAAAGVPPELRRDSRYVPAAGALDGVELFDAGFFGYSPREAELMDPQQRLFLECAWEALEDAGYDSRRTPGPAGVFASLGFNRYLHQILTAVDPAEVGGLQLALGNDKDFLATRVSYKLDLTGPSLTVQTACSSSLVAVHVACQNLLQGDCDMALAGGVSIVLPQRAGYLYEEGGIASPDGRCRAFDTEARGTVFGSGGGLVVLKRLEDALADGDTIRAVLLGSAVNNDGGSGKAGYTAPSVSGQAAAVSAALAAAGVDPATVSYVEAHGTGTPLGDPIEVQALAQAFRRGGAREGSCALGSVKSNLGHLDTAAGVTGLIKTVLALEHRVLPPSLGFTQPNPRIDFAAGPFHVQAELAPWERGSSPRRAGVSSFGIGGTNAHAVLEEPPAAAPSESARPWHLLVLSARTPEALERKRIELAGHLERHPETHLADSAYTLQLGRRPFAQRSIAVVRDGDDAAAVLRGEEPGRLFARTVPDAAPPVVFLFPGQGSQRPGMGAGLYAAEPVFRREVDRACEILLPILGFDLRELLLAPADSEEAARRLESTEVTQPALFVIEHALARLWVEWGVRPEALIGHSLGEYVAACLAGVFSLEDALALVAARGRLVASLPPGAMLAVSLPEAEAVRRAEESGLAVAAVNAPGSCVLSGPTEAVERLAGRLASEGIEHRRLHTSHAFHSEALDPVLDRFREEVARLDLQAPRLPWISNLTGTWIGPEEATDPGYWTRHLREAVRFADGAEELLRVPGRIYLEVGPGRSLSSLVRQRLGRSEEGAVLTSLPRTGEPEEDVRQVSETLGRLWLAGVEIDWPAVHAHEARRRVPLPTYPFERQRFWIEGKAAAKDLARADRRRGIDEWLYAPAWRRTAPPARPAAPAEGGVWLLFADSSGLARALAERLERSGHTAVLVEAGEGFSRRADGGFVLDPTRAADYAELLAALQPEAIVHGWSLEAAQELGLHSLLYLVRALADRPSVRLSILGNGLNEVTGSEDLRPAQAGLQAVARVVSQEHPGIACRVVDLERIPAARSREMDLLFAELSGAEADPLVAFRGGHRWVPAWERVEAGVSRGEPVELRERGVYLITGGFGRIGLTLAELLAGSVRARLVLLGRAPLPERLPALEAMGAEVLPLAVDVTDRQALEAAVRQAEERFGRVDGVIHAAAHISFQTLGETGPDELAAAFHAKVHGARALAEVLRGRDLDFVLAFSSLSSLLGGLGFAAYAAANACLDAFVLRHRREVATPWITVAWDGWRFPGDANPPGARAHTAMTPEEGKEVFLRILSLGALPHLAVSTTDLEARLDLWVRGSAPAPPETASHTRPELRSAYEPPRSETESVLASLWQGLLGVDRVGAHDDFFELGGHSLMATQLLTRIREAFAATVSLRDLFEAPTLAGLAARIEEALPAGASRGAPPLVPTPRTGPLPLSFGQQRLWLVDQLETGSALYNVAVALSIEGALDSAALARTLDEIVRRHEALRTVFAAPDGVPAQVILPAQPFRLPVVDLSGLPEGRREPQALALAGEAAGRPFDLARGPLLCGVLLRLAPEDHLATLAMHHIVSDGWSMGLLVREVAALYPAFAAGRPSPLPPLPVQYADFAVWQRSWLQGEVLEHEIDWWRRQLAGLPPLLELPTDRPRPAAQSYRGATRPVRLSAGLARQEGATLFMVLLAGFQALLGRFSGQDDLAVGSPVAGRSRREVEGLIGFFVNTLVLRGDLSGAPTFGELLGRVRETALAAYLHQDAPFEKLVDELAPERSLAHAPLFQAMLVLQNAPAGSLEIEDLSVRPVSLKTTAAKFDLTLLLEEEDGGLAGTIEYATDLFDAATIDRLAGHFERLLAAAVGAPERRVWELPWLGEAELQQTLLEWNDTFEEPLGGALVHEAISESAGRSPGALAVAWDGGEMTYGELERRSNQLARRLRRLGVGPEVFVGLCCDRSGDLVVGVLGILKAGGAYVPLDPEYPEDRLKHMLADCAAPVLVAQERTVGLAALAGARLVRIDAPDLALEEEGPLPLAALPENPAYVIYTSGSTGRPKGVVVTHGTLVDSTRARRTFYREPVEAYLLASSFAFDSSVAGLFWTLWDGGTLVLHRDQFQLNLPDFLTTLEGHRASHLLCLPSLYSLILEHARPGQLASLKTVIVAGEACPPALVARHAAELPGVALVNEYGPTEGTVWSSAGFLTPSRAISIGRPIRNVRLYLLDRSLEPVPAGVHGELWIGGALLARGYLNRPDLTAERFLPDPLSAEPGARMYRTGDRVRFLPDGSLDFLGRVDHQVKVRGFRIELGEIEAVLRSLPGVRETVVVARGQRLVAYVNADATVEELRQSLRERLPDYMVPAAFVKLAAFPLTANGKVDRKALPAPELPGAGPGYVAPRTREEEILAAVWAQVLRLPRVGVSDNFFELGGDSIVSVQVVARARQAGLVFTVKQIFEHPTVAGLARHATALEEPSELPRKEAGESYPLTPLQSGMLFHSLMAPESGVYVNQVTCTLPADLDAGLFRQAWERLVERHEVLRTAFLWEGLDEPRQAVRESVSLPWQELDWRGLPAEEQERRFEELRQSERHTPLPLFSAPLLRFSLVRLERELGFVWTFHHLLLDGWSQPLLVRELEAVYAALREGREPALPPVRPFSDYIAWLQEQDAASAEPFWRGELSGFTAPNPLGLDRPQRGEGYDEHRIEVSREVTAELQALAARHHLTLQTVTLGAWAVLVSRYSGEEDVVFGSAVSGRPAALPGVETMVGLFINTLPVRVRVNGAEPLAAWLQRLQERQLARQEFEHTPLAQIQRWSEVPAGSPLFETLYVFENYPDAGKGGSGSLGIGNLRLLESTNYPVTLMLTAGDQVSLYLSTDRARVEEEAAPRLLQHLATLLTGMTRADLPLSELPLLSAAEQRQLLEWGGIREELATTSTLHGRFSERARRTPGAPALTSGDVTLTYGELDRRSNRLAHWLRGQGAGPESRVGLSLDRSVDLVVGILGVLKSGAAYVPLDPGSPKERTAFVVEDAEIRIVVEDLEPFKNLPDHDLEPLGDASSLAYVIYTSGSTGKPKGTLITHANVTRLFDATESWFGFGEQDVWTLFHSYAFDFSVWEIWGALLYGGRLVVVPWEVSRSPEPFLDLLVRERVTVLNQTPSAFAQLAQADAERGGVATDLRLVIFGGEALDPASLGPWFARHGETQPRLVNMYGITETTVHVTYRPLTAADARSVIGVPIPDLSLAAVDRSLRPAPIGVPGELVVGGAGLARGYLGRPELTAERFVPDPAGRGARLYRSGDLGRFLPNGEVEYLGRLDHQVKIRGFRIELGEIEAALVALPGVRQAVVIVREDRLVAYVVGDAEVAGLRQALRERLPDYMVPAAFVVLEALPLTVNGKVDRKALPAPEALGAREGYVAPRTREEELLAAVWAQVLRLPRVGVSDNFFELGGDSILSVQIVSRARQAGLVFTVREIFRHQTVADLALHVTVAEATGGAEQGAVAGEVPLTPIQRWFFAQGFADPHHWNQALWLESREPLAPAALERAMATLVEHHDALRMRFDGQRQENAPAEPGTPFYQVDLSALPAPHEAFEPAAAALQAGFDLSAGPLTRLVLFNAGGGPSRLLWVTHHLVVDGVSWRVLLEDFEAAYRKASLPPKTTSFQEWARRLTGHAGALAGELDHWRETARASVPRLPVDLPSGRDLVGDEASVSFELTAEETASLLQTLPAVYHTRIDEALLSALARAFSWWSGSPRVRVDLEGHGREPIFDDVDLSRTVGWFTTLYPVVLEAGDAVPGEALVSTKERLRAVPGRGIGYGLLQAAGLLEAAPAAEVLFNYLGQAGAEEGSLFRASTASVGPSRSPRAHRTHPLEIVGLVAEGRLRITLTYGSRRYRQETAERLATAYAEALRQLIAHGRESEEVFTPSDFPKAGLDRHGFQQLTSLLPNLRDVEDVYPLTTLQSGMLFHSLMAPESGVYVTQVTCALPADLDLGRFRQAWERLIERHTVLRTAFLWEGLDEPRQAVRRSVALPWQELDWRGLSAEEQARRFEELRQSDRHAPIPLDRAPLLRFFLIRTDGELRFLWTSHHLLLDGWSLPLLVQELTAVYAAEAALPPARPFSDYVVWLQKQDPAKAEPFWREELAGFTAPNSLGGILGVEHPAERSAGQAEHEIRLSREVTAELQALAARHKLTLQTVTSGAWAALVSRYSSDFDVVFGGVVSGRPAALPGVETMVGMFVNTLPVRVRVEGAEPVAAWLQGVQDRQLARQELEHTPLAQIQRWSEVPAGSPLFETLYVFENYPDADGAASGALGLRDLQSFESTNYPVTLVLTGGDRISLHLATDRARVDGDAAPRLLRHLATLLTGMAERPGSRVGELDLLTAAERRQILGEWNDTRVAGLAEGCLHHPVALQAARRPSAVAVELGREQWTYRRLAGSARLLARHLRELGVGPDAIVGLCADRSPAMVVGMLAILEAGGAWLPLDPAYPPERLAFMLDDSGARVLLLQEHLRERVGTAADRLRVVPLDARWDSDEETEALGIEVTPEHLAYVIYTSGSTGRPKGVMVPHGAICNRLGWAHRLYRIDERDAVLQKASFGFDFSVWECFAPLWAGGRLVLAEPGRQGDVPYLLEVLREHRVTFAHFVPSMLAAFLAEEGVETCDSLRQVFSGGEALTPELRDRALSRLPAAFDNEYGPTETTVDSTQWACAPGQDPRRVPIGRPISNTQVYVVDPELRLVPAGVAGELLVGGAGVTRGYLRRPGLTAEKFVPDPFGGVSGARLYRTGDLARWLPDGSIDYLGRLDHQVKIRGLRIELGEIESALTALPGIRQAVVVARESRLIAYVVGHTAADELRRSLRERLPDYMVPAVFVTLEALPLTASGKVDRKALPAPEQPGAREEGYVAPRTREEEILAAVWAQVLRLPRVGVHDNFFELGGDSILSIQIVARARQAGLLFTVREIFEHQTVAGLALHVTATDAAVALAGQEPVAGEVPLTPIQSRFFDQGVEDLHHWNQALLLTPREPLAPADLERALATIVAHHDALRMRFDGRRQENAPAEPVTPFHQVDLSGLPAPHEAFEEAAAALQAGFDLAGGPLTRLCLFDTGAGTSRLLWVTHHLVVDGISWRVLLEDLEAAYRKVSLPPKTTSFQEWARRLTGHAEALAGELGYWRETAQSRVPRLPVDFPSGGNLVADEATVSFELTAEETSDLLQTLPSVYHSRIDEALLAALVRALEDWTGSPRLRVDLEGHGREPLFDDLDVSRTVGWFTSVYPVVLEAGDADPGEALVSAKERLRAVPGRGIGYGLLQAAGLLEAAPPSEILFNYLGQADATFEELSLFRVSTGGTGPSRSPRARRSYPLEVVGIVAEGRLRVTLTYGSRLYRRETAERLAEAYARALRQLLQHSRESEEVFTPSDFGKARLDAKSLAKVAALLADSED